MNATAQKILVEALVLSESERAELAAELIDSLDACADADAQEAWGAEVAHRIGELDSGKVTCIPWDEARKIIAGGTHARRRPGYWQARANHR
ncbi:MAG: addiction module protein [Pirellulales bacterium]